MLKETVIETRFFVKDMPLPKKSKAEHEDDFKLFADNFKLIWKYEDLIIRTQEYFYIILQKLEFGTMITGGFYISLGILLLLWKEGKLLSRCPQCRCRAYIYWAGGSGLSAGNVYFALCPECITFFKGSVEKFGTEILSPVLEKKNAYPNKRHITVRRTQWFSWGKGLMGQPKPDEIRDGIQPIEFKCLIEKLKENDIRSIRNQVE